MNNRDSRYYRWRHAIHRHSWVIDQHWYTMLGWLHVSSVRMRMASMAVAVECAVESAPNAALFERNFWRHWSSVVFDKAQHAIDDPDQLGYSSYLQMDERIAFELEFGDSSTTEMLRAIKAAFDKFDTHFNSNDGTVQ